METLFRGQSQFGKHEWLIGSLVIREVRGEKIYYILPLDFDGCWSERRVMQDHLDQTVGQYTELTDMTGAKIFEGDIVKNQNKDSDAFEDNAAVTWHKSLGAWTVIFEEIGQDKLLSQYALIQVVGNIHNNPELLCKQLP